MKILTNKVYEATQRSMAADEALIESQENVINSLKVLISAQDKMIKVQENLITNAESRLGIKDHIIEILKNKIQRLEDELDQIAARTKAEWAGLTGNDS